MASLSFTRTALPLLCLRDIVKALQSPLHSGDLERVSSSSHAKGVCIGSNCPGISGTVPDFLPLSRVPESPILCPGSKLGRNVVTE